MMCGTKGLSVTGLCLVLLYAITEIALIFGLKETLSFCLFVLVRVQVVSVCLWNRENISVITFSCISAYVRVV